MKVDFASYGTPSGTCPDLTFGSCHAINSQSVAEQYLLGNNSASIPAGNWIFGDPCPNTAKQLSIKATYCEPVCSGILPATITGSALPAGTTYLWESSTTSAATGFTNAAGINNEQNYGPEALTQTTWFRRTATSGSLSTTSSVVAISVTSCIPAFGMKSPDNPALEQTAVEEAVFDESMVMVYPVPNSGRFNATINTDRECSIDIKIYNATGAKVLEMQNVSIQGKTILPFNLEESPAGIYYLRVVKGSTQVTRKIMINR